MNTVRIEASHSYDVHIGSGLLSNAGAYISRICKKVKLQSSVIPMYTRFMVNHCMKTSWNPVIK